MSSHKLCNIQAVNPIRAVIGSLVHEDKSGHSMLKIDLCTLIPLCRSLAGQAEGMLEGSGRPYDSIPDPPLVQVDWQICRQRGKRVKMGYCFTQDFPDGGIVYQVRMDVGAVLKAFDMLFLHGHSETEEEATERMKDNDRQSATG